MKKLLLLLICTSLWAENGRVTKVTDGDTVWVKMFREDDSTYRLKCRLFGIDAPEKAQDQGKESTLALLNLIEGEALTVTVVDTDRYLRSICQLSRQSDKEPDAINLRMVQSGHAWAYVPYLKKYGRDYVERYVKAQREAKNLQRGVWKDESPQPPWEYRSERKRRR